jgi:hypothetical protein
MTGEQGCRFASRRDDCPEATTRSRRGDAGQVMDEQILAQETVAERLEVGPFAHSKTSHMWPLLRPWSRVRPDVRAVPLSSGPNLSLNRLGGVPLRWSHPCLLQPLGNRYHCET